MFGLGKRAKIKKVLHSLQADIAANSMRFAVDVTETFADVSQSLLFAEALCFFLHVLNRVAFRGSAGDSLRDALNPVAVALAKLYGDMFVGKISNYTADQLRAETINMMNVREEIYAKCKSLIGEPGEDRNNVLWLAVTTIAESVGKPKQLLFIMQMKILLMDRLIEMDMSKRLLTLEALL